jgi:hypothetical protein
LCQHSHTFARTFIFASTHPFVTAFSLICQHPPTYASIRRLMPAFAHLYQHPPFYATTFICASTHPLVPSSTQLCQHPPTYASFRQLVPALAHVSH